MKCEREQWMLTKYTLTTVVGRDLLEIPLRRENVLQNEQEPDGWMTRRKTDATQCNIWMSTSWGVLLLPETNILLSPLEPHLWNIFDCSDKSYTQWNVDGDDHHDCHHHSYHSIEYLASHFHSKIFRFPFWGKWGIIVDFWTVWRQCTARCCVKRDNL